MTTQRLRTTTLTVALAAVLVNLTANAVSNENIYPNASVPQDYTGITSVLRVAWVPPDVDYRPSPRPYQPAYGPQYQPDSPPQFNSAFDPAFDPRQLQAELANSRAELQRTTERLEAAQALLQQAREALSIKFNEHQQQRVDQAAKTEQLSTATAEVLAAHARIAELSSELQTIRAELAQQQAQLSKYSAVKDGQVQEQAMTQQLLAETARLEVARGAVETQYQSCQQQLATYKTDIESVQSEQATTKTALSDALVEKDRLQAELQTLSAEFQSHQSELVRVQGTETNLAKQRDALKAQLAAVEDNAQSNESAAKSAALTEQLVQTKATLDAELDAKTALQQALADAVSARERLLAQMDSLNAQLTGVKSQDQAAQGELQQQLLACNERLFAANAAITTSGTDAAMTPADTQPAQPQKVHLAALESATVQADSADHDSDGVPDNKDLCPDSASAVQVDATGCITDETIILQGVNFRYDSDALTNASRTALEHVARILREQLSLRLEIAGHSDSQGDAAYNLWLSEQRAKSVMTYLVSQGVPAERLSARGYGGSQPISENTTREGLASNRRVELRKRP